MPGDPFRVDFVPTARVQEAGGEPLIKACVLARIYPAAKGRARPLITLIGDDLAAVLDQVRLWHEQGRPTLASIDAGEA